MNIGYFIAGSLHYLPLINPLISETGGTIITFKKGAEKYISEGTRDYKIIKYKNYKSLIRDFPKLKLEILVHPSFSAHFFKKVSGVKHVQVFHGISDKPFSFHKSLKSYDLITVPGSKKKEDIIKKGLASADKIEIIGFPKLDHFLHSDFDHGVFMDEIGIDRSKKTVLYSPTWADRNKYSSFSKFVVSILRNLTEYNVIVKPHVNILKYKPWQILKAYMLKRKNCYIFPKSMNVLPFMAVSDIMITDISSVAQEYLAFDKPLVFLSSRPENTIPEGHKWIWKCGDVIEDKRDISRIVKKGLENPDEYKTQRKSAKSYIFFEFDGRSSLRFKELIMKLAG
jgi:CDP-glycerol glycerophosphotransferase (TagB/SpsB family)